jgi:uncharacterized repeat protein (TIGR03803 family)
MPDISLSTRKSAVLALVFLTLSAAAMAQAKFAVLHAFGSGSDGRGPWGQLLADKAGNFYGTTIGGGPNNVGTVFEVSPSGSSWTESVLYSFVGNNLNLQGPQSNLVMDTAGNLYGTTFWGGINNGGTIFELSPVSGGGWAETVLFKFQGKSGISPGGLLLGRNGALYGTTLWGNTAYELNPPAVAGGSWTGKVLFTFDAGSNGNGPFYEGAALISDKHGNLYGVTYLGGAYGEGEVFELSPPATQAGAWTETILFSFGGYTTDGRVPTGAVVMDAAGNIYGTTVDGGSSNAGTVFEISPPASQGQPWTETLLHTFTGGTSDGSAPYAGLVMDRVGNLYGVTYSGGTGLCQFNFPGCGTVFKVSPTGGSTWTTTVLHNFQGSSDGEFPYGGLMINGVGHLFGTTSGGGKYGYGTVFEIQP